MAASGVLKCGPLYPDVAAMSAGAGEEDGDDDGDAAVLTALPVDLAAVTLPKSAPEQADKIAMTSPAAEASDKRRASELSMPRSIR
jgi:hypothetical protein